MSGRSNTRMCRALPDPLLFDEALLVVKDEMIHCRRIARDIDITCQSQSRSVAPSQPEQAGGWQFPISWANLQWWQEQITAVLSTTKAPLKGGKCAPSAPFPPSLLSFYPSLRPSPRPTTSLKRLAHQVSIAILFSNLSLHSAFGSTTATAATGIRSLTPPPPTRRHGSYFGHRLSSQFPLL